MVLGTYSSKEVHFSETHASIFLIVANSRSRGERGGVLKFVFAREVKPFEPLKACPIKKQKTK